ncbi:MAG: hypothetical protein J5642_03585 [Bacteroidales bacterium]|nr:hypothetical protein [Bacteroidales bacterium]
MKQIITMILVCFGCLAVAYPQSATTRSKKNLTIKEWNTTAGSNSRYLDHVTYYNANGKKTEEIEYANYGQKSRITYEYDANGNCVRQVVYDSKNKAVRIRKFEYYEDGSKKKQYNYAPSGKLISTKEFEYIFGN